MNDFNGPSAVSGPDTASVPTIPSGTRYIEYAGSFLPVRRCGRFWLESESHPLAWEDGHSFVDDSVAWYCPGNHVEPVAKRKRAVMSLAGMVFDVVACGHTCPAEKGHWWNIDQGEEEYWCPGLSLLQMNTRKNRKST